MSDHPIIGKIRNGNPKKRYPLCIFFVYYIIHLLLCQ